MDILNAHLAFAALGQPTRLKIFRVLIAAGDKGIVAGDIGKMLGVRQNTLSNNLSSMVHVGLIRNHREGRSIRYFADFDGMRRLLGYFLHDCCGASRSACEALVDDIICTAAASPPNSDWIAGLNSEVSCHSCLCSHLSATLSHCFPRSFYSSHCRSCILPGGSQSH